MKIVKYTPERRQDFVDLNVWWIEKYFGAVEQADRDEFDHVEDEIAKGGMVFFAVDEADGAALATCMAIDRGEGEWEIAKLGSAPDRPHKGHGKAVFEACVDWAEQHGAKRIRDALLTHIAPGSLIDHDKEKAHKSLVKAAKCTDEA